MGACVPTTGAITESAIKNPSPVWMARSARWISVSPPRAASTSPSAATMAICARTISATPGSDASESPTTPPVMTAIPALRMINVRRTSARRVHRRHVMTASPVRWTPVPRTREPASTRFWRALALSMENASALDRSVRKTHANNAFHKAPQSIGQANQIWSPATQTTMDVRQQIHAWPEPVWPGLR